MDYYYREILYLISRDDNYFRSFSVFCGSKEVHVHQFLNRNEDVGQSICIGHGLWTELYASTATVKFKKDG